MAWTAPPTFTAGNALTAAQLNILGTDLNETAPAKSTAAGQYFVAGGVNSIVARSCQSSFVTASETTISTSYADLATPGPAVTVTSGSQCLVLMNALVQNNTSGNTSSIGFDISGATTSAASTVYISITAGAANQQITGAGVRMAVGMTSGSNTFTMKYVVNGGTGTFSRRFLTVMPF